MRDAAREQVESMGAQFIAVDAQGIAGSSRKLFLAFEVKLFVHRGEGAGGYATAKSQVKFQLHGRALSL